MAHAFVDRPKLKCPQCRRSFALELWLIIHAAERPDLLAHPELLTDAVHERRWMNMGLPGADLPRKPPPN